MSIRALPLDFTQQGGIWFPNDKPLLLLAEEFAKRELAEPVTFTDYRKVLVACECDENGKPIRVVGMNCAVLRPDYPVWRYTTPEAGIALENRTRAYLEDQGVPRGTEVFVFVADKEAKESRCPRWRSWLRRTRAKKSRRWSISL